MSKLRSAHYFALLALSVIFLTQFSLRTATAQTTGLRGVVLNMDSGVPVPLAHLYLQSKVEKDASARSISAGDDGMFFLDGLRPGNYTLRVTRVGYRPLLMEVQLPADQERDLIIYLSELPFETRPIVVTGTHRHSAPGHDDDMNRVLRGRQLDRELGLSLAATLKNEAGLAMRGMGPAPARPVIRGLGGDRVFLAEDGIRTVDLSATSPDHAVTIDPFGAERIEVMRGPRVLTKSPVTIGGMVNVVRHDIPLDMHDDILGSLGFYAESANRGYLGSLITEAPLRPFLFRGELSRRETGDVNTPEGVLINSYSRMYSYTMGGSMIRDFGVVGGAHRVYDIAYGVPGGFIGAHPRGVNIQMERRQTSVRANLDLGMPFLHDITFSGARTWYRHAEYEASGRIGSTFRIIDWQGTLQANHHGYQAIEEGSVGLFASYRDIRFGGYVFTPPGTSFALAPFVYERFHFGRFSMEAAFRYNHDRITPLREDRESRIGHIRARNFDTWSASMSLLYPLTDIVRVGVNLSRSSRVPTMEELYSEGPHLAAYSYEIGNPDLPSEHGIGLETFVTHRFDDLSWTFTVFRNAISSFIVPRNTGRLNYSTFLPVYQTSAVEALLYGAEGQLDWELVSNIRLELSIAYTHGILRESATPLPQIPPLKGRGGITWRGGAWNVGVSMDAAARQDRVDEFEETTAGYAVMNAWLQYTRITDGVVHNVSLNGDNLFNKAYRNHLSRVKSILPEAGISLRLTYKMHFSL
jgi:iron complex outermembrane recepter protein